MSICMFTSKIRPFFLWYPFSPSALFLKISETLPPIIKSRQPLMPHGSIFSLTSHCWRCGRDFDYWAAKKRAHTCAKARTSVLRMSRTTDVGVFQPRFDHCLLAIHSYRDFNRYPTQFRPRACFKMLHPSL